ncbi:MAG: Uma2 family endonuclease [Gloeomargarita sp. SKYG116]|nr:Uma2 family endonuclease [Gloeomargarita sp. SKYG116]MDW8401436.1 Uma2 family endonuclease [Gloeomargarita sp. SKYGB_i_bin116]
MPIPVYVPETFKVDDEQFLALSQANPDLCLEQAATGELIVMPPTGGETGRCNAELITELVLWNRQVQLGEVFDSTTGLRLPNGAIWSPDVAWVKQERWQALAPEQRQYVPIL